MLIDRLLQRLPEKLNKKKVNFMSNITQSYKNNMSSDERGSLLGNIFGYRFDVDTDGYFEDDPESLYYEDTQGD